MAVWFTQPDILVSGKVVGYDVAALSQKICSTHIGTNVESLSVTDRRVSKPVNP